MILRLPSKSSSGVSEDAITASARSSVTAGMASWLVAPGDGARDELFSVKVSIFTQASTRSPTARINDVTCGLQVYFDDLQRQYLSGIGQITYWIESNLRRMTVQKSQFSHSLASVKMGGKPY
jgi:hypothetical protein